MDRSLEASVSCMDLDAYFMSCQNEWRYVRRIRHTCARSMGHTLAVDNRQMVENILGCRDDDAGTRRNVRKIVNFPSCNTVQGYDVYSRKC